jgi:Cu/Ag efflux pump CusA
MTAGFSNKRNMKLALELVGEIVGKIGSERSPADANAVAFMTACLLLSAAAQLQSKHSREEYLRLAADALGTVPVVGVAMFEIAGEKETAH